VKSDTVMIGLHPLMAQLSLPDSTPGFEGVGSPGNDIRASGRYKYPERYWAFYRRP